MPAAAMQNRAPWWVAPEWHKPDWQDTRRARQTATGTPPVAEGTNRLSAGPANVGGTLLGGWDGNGGWYRGSTCQTDRKYGVVNEARRALCRSPKAQTGSQPDRQAVGGTLVGGWNGKGGWHRGGTSRTDREYGVVNEARRALCQSPKAQTGSQPGRSAPGWKGRRSDEGAMDSTRPRCSGILRISPHAQSPANFRTV